MTMNKKFIFSTAALLLLTMSCSNNNNNMTDDGKVNTAQAVEFKVDFADYNAEQNLDVTRAGNKEEKLEQQTIDLGNGILAQCTLQRDTTKQEKQAATRSLRDGTYTMLAYDATTHAYKGEITGTVTGGNTFTSTSANKDLVLAPGIYDFVLYNNKVTRSGNNLSVYRFNADEALIGRTQQVITATPHKQLVQFTMKHVGAKVNILLEAYLDCSNLTTYLSSVNATDVPNSSTYDASTGTWTIGAGSSVSERLTYTGAGYSLPVPNDYISLAKSNEAAYFMPSTDVSKLKLEIHGTIYNVAMFGTSFTFKPASTLKLEQNGAYVLKVKLKYNFLYLMSDGTTDFINSTNYTTLRENDGITKRYVDKNGLTLETPKTPIAVVLSQSRRMAIALEDANGGSPCNWTSKYEYIWSGPVNTHTHATAADAFNFNSTSGRDETWDASYTYIVTGEPVKGKNPDFPAFKAAADYNPGVTYTGSPTLQWYLPSATDWLVAYSALGFGKATVNDAGGYDWYGKIADLAFTQVGGTGLIDNFYQSSSECNTFQAIHTYMSKIKMHWDYVGNKGNAYPVRPFVEY